MDQAVAIAFDNLPLLLSGLWVTLQLTALAFGLAVVLGTLGAACRTVPFTPLNWLGATYVEFFRNTPLLVQMFFAFFALPAVGISLPGFVAAFIALGVYTGAFMRDRHVRALGLHPGLPLLEAYDYGFHHPCVVWAQWAPWGHFWVLGGVMGSDLHLDAFLPVVERYRQQWFPNRLRLDVTCDPAGAANNSQGLRGTPVGMLRDWYQANGERDATGAFVVPQYLPDANHPERRTAANQRIATYMRRQVQQEEAFLVDPERWALVELGSEKADTWFVDGLEAGYVFEDKPRFSATLGTYSLAKKDGFFEHGQNCLEYLAQMFVLDLPQSNEQALKTQATHAAKLVRDNERAASKALRAAQKDVDPEDKPRNRYGFAGRRVMARRAVGRRFR